MDNIRLNDARVHVHWIPAHTGVPGKGMADKVAKEATGHRAKELLRDNDIQATGWPALLAATIQSFFSLTKEKWQPAWDRSTHSIDNRKTVTYATKNVITLWKGMNKAYSSIIIQMRTKIALGDLLHQYGVKDTP